MKAVDRITRRKWQALKWGDPRTHLIELGKLQSRMPDATVDALRSERDLKWAVEQRQAALFSHCISYALQTPIAYAMSEDADYDCVLCRRIDGKKGYTPVQLKEIVPSHIDPMASIKTGLAKLSKYRTSHHTVVAVNVNRAGYFDYSLVQKPETSFAEIWLYASLQADQSLWALYGDLLHEPRGYMIPWPRWQTKRAPPKGSPPGATCARSAREANVSRPLLRLARIATDHRELGRYLELVQSQVRAELGKLPHSSGGALLLPQPEALTRTVR